MHPWADVLDLLLQLSGRRSVRVGTRRILVRDQPFTHKYLYFNPAVFFSTLMGGVVPDRVGFAISHWPDKSAHRYGIIFREVLDHGIRSPLATRAGLHRHAAFGMLQRTTFKEVLRWLEEADDPTASSA